MAIVATTDYFRVSRAALATRSEVRNLPELTSRLISKLYKL